jgi:hypothetical protein
MNIETRRSTTLKQRVIPVQGPLMFSVSFQIFRTRPRRVQWPCGESIWDEEIPITTRPHFGRAREGLRALAGAEPIELDQDQLVLFPLELRRLRSRTSRVSNSPPTPNYQFPSMSYACRQEYSVALMTSSR